MGNSDRRILTLGFILLLLLKVCFSEETLSSPAIEANVPLTPIISASNPTDNVGNVTLRINSALGAPKVLNVSQAFVDFLEEDPAKWKTRGHFDGCMDKCYDNLYYIRRIQQEYRYRSLFEMYYQLSVSRGCFCHDIENFDDDGDNDDDDDGPLFQWTLSIGRSANRLSSSASAEVDQDRLKVRGRNCPWENVIYWLLRLIHCGIYDLERYELRLACRECICHR